MAHTIDELMALVKSWATKGESEAALLVLGALLKKNKSYDILEAYLEVVQKNNIGQAYNLHAQIISNSEEWNDFFVNLSDIEKAHLYEWNAQLAFTLKDEIAALDSLQRSAALGRNTLSLRSLLTLLQCSTKNFSEALNSYHQCLDLYFAPTLLSERMIGNFLKIENNKGFLQIDENFFVNLSMMLIVELSNKEKTRLIQHLSYVFPKRSWLLELQDFVSKASENSPIT